MAFHHTGTVEIHTDRLLLRQFAYDDAQQMLRNWIGNPEVQHNYGEPAYESLDAVRELLDRWLPRYRDGDFYRWPSSTSRQAKTSAR